MGIHTDYIKKNIIKHTDYIINYHVSKSNDLQAQISWTNPTIQACLSTWPTVVFFQAKKTDNIHKMIDIAV